MTSKRILVSALGAALLQGVYAPPALADDDWDRYVDSGYQYCDAVMLGAHWGQSVDEAKATIGRKLGWGNRRIIESDLHRARDRNIRCQFEDTGFGFEDAEALAQMWEVAVDEAKAALAEKVSMGMRDLADEVVAQAHSEANGD